MNDIMIKVDHVSKKYRLGQIGETTLRYELQNFKARLLKKENPNKQIGYKDLSGKNSTFMALNGVSFEVKTGERVGIIGKNGAGKSTLLKLISRVTGPTSGEIGLNGRVASMLEVGTGFHEELTGRENIYMNGAILGMTKKEIDSKIEDIIDFSECRQFIDTPVKRYSSGMYVKLAFSVAAHLDSEIMIMDEVLAVGDMAFQKKCLDKMNEISQNQNRTILYVSHNMKTIRELCNRVIVLSHGTVVFDGPVEEGISVYMDDSDFSALSIDYTADTKYNSMKCSKIRALYTSFENRESSVFTSNELPKFNIKIKNDADITKMSFRIEIFKSDYESIIGSACINEFYSGSINDVSSFDFSLNISSLCNGKYSTKYVFFFRDDFGNIIDADTIKGLSFSIQNEDNSWISEKYGSVCLPDLILE